MNYLLAFPNSGITWFRYCIEVLTECPTLSNNPEEKPIFLNNVNVNVSSNDFILRKENFWRQVDETSVSKLILLIRDPIDSFIEFGNLQKKNITLFHHGLLSSMQFMENLIAFDTFDRPKQIYYYDDLFLDYKLEEIFVELLDFLGHQDKFNKIPDFVENLSRHKLVFSSIHKTFDIEETITENEKNLWIDELKKFDLSGENLIDKYLFNYL